MEDMSSRKFRITSAVLMVVALLSGTVALLALFSDKAATSYVASEMAKVDIALSNQNNTYEIDDYGEAVVYFTLRNTSNIDIYLRTGIILELLDKNGQHIIADTGDFEIKVTDTTSGWRASQKLLKSGEHEYKKWFLEYVDKDGNYNKYNGGTKNSGFTVCAPDSLAGYMLRVDAVPEAVQADNGNDALEYFKNNVQDQRNPVIPEW